MNAIIIYTTSPKSQRFKTFIPYTLKEEREWLKSLNSAFYHPTQKLWSLINTIENKKLVASAFTGKYEIQTMEQGPIKKPALITTDAARKYMLQGEQKFVLKSFSPSTIKNYLGALSYFFSFFNNRNYLEIEKADIEAYVYHLKTKYKISDTNENTNINAIKAFYEHVLGRPREYYDIQRPNKAKTLPNIFTNEEIAKLMETPMNIKHKAILMVIYAAGLPISEAVNLKIKPALCNR